MKNNEHINQLTEEALNSLDGTSRATAKPYLLTRLNARMQNAKESNWDNALRFISKPAVALAGLCLVIAINARWAIVTKSKLQRLCKMNSMHQ